MASLGAPFVLTQSRLRWAVGLSGSSVRWLYLEALPALTRKLAHSARPLSSQRRRALTLTGKRRAPGHRRPGALFLSALASARPPRENSSFGRQGRTLNPVEWARAVGAVESRDCTASGRNQGQNGRADRNAEDREQNDGLEQCVETAITAVATWILCHHHHLRLAIDLDGRLFGARSFFSVYPSWPAWRRNRALSDWTRSRRVRRVVPLRQGQEVRRVVVC